MADPTGRPPAALTGQGLTLGYDGRTVCRDVDVLIPTGELTVIVGPNACGKSTLLRGLCRLLPARTGSVLLDGRQITSYGTKEVARRVGLMAQTAQAPDGITVADLVGRGRYPHQGLFATWTAADERAVQEAMRLARVHDLADRAMDELSGGQRQRAWVAMVLAQQTPVLMLDEPTTYLDIAHQVELLELLADLHEQGRTVVAVLHDLNQAAHYATNVIAMRAGKVVAVGPPAEVITAESVQEIFGLTAQVIADPFSGSPLVIPTPPPRRTSGDAPSYS